MTEKKICFDELCEQVLKQLESHGYMESTLTIYRRFYNRIHTFINACGTDIYTEEIGRKFLNGIHVCESTFTSYVCAVRRLDDYINGKPYRCHHGNPYEEVPEKYAEILDTFLEECRESGNKLYTINAKRNVCTKFLNYIEQSECHDLSDMDASLVSHALLIYTNKDYYSQIRMFLRHLAGKGITKSDLSGIVPHYKRQRPLPTTYTPTEISKIEDSINIETATGRRDLAIIRLATRMGFRSGDIARLSLSEIDFNSGYISIIQEKTGQPLSLQMPSEVSGALLSHLENIGTRPKDGYVFHSMSAPYGRITTSIIRHAVVKHFKTAGIDTTGKKHGPHAFRSSLASSMINDGGSYETVRRILGHTDPDVIKHYAKTDIEKLRLCAINPPAPSGILADYLSGKKVIGCV